MPADVATQESTRLTLDVLESWKRSLSRHGTSLTSQRTGLGGCLCPAPPTVFRQAETIFTRRCS